ncbi:MAG: hypothetical protein ACOYL6_09015 [Bacteriovoracaceae bacterium]
MNNDKLYRMRRTKFLAIILSLAPMTTFAQLHGGGKPDGEPTNEEHIKGDFLILHDNLMKAINKKRSDCFLKSWEIENLATLRSNIMFFNPKGPFNLETCYYPGNDIETWDKKKLTSCLFKEEETQKLLNSVLSNNYYFKYMKSIGVESDEATDLRNFYIKIFIE